MMVAKNWIGYAPILCAALFSLADCSSSGSASKQTAAEMAMSVRLNSLEERVAYLEKAISRAPNSANNQSIGYGSPESGMSGSGVGGNIAAAPSDQQDYERQVQALCAAKGVDCTM